MGTLLHPASVGPASLPAASLDLARLLGPAAWHRLPPIVRRRFAPDHADAIYEGRMDLDCSTVGRIVAWLSILVGSPLVGVRARAVPTSVTVRPDGAGGVVWERRFDLAGAVRRVSSTKRLDRDGQLQERLDGGLRMELDVSEQSGALVFESRRYVLALGPWRLTVPMLLTPGTCRVAHTDLGDGRFRFELEMRHPWWGRTVSQSGVFTDPVD